MTWANRIRLFIGLVVVLAVFAACTVVFNQRKLSVDSLSASIVAEEYSIGSSYAGTVTAQYVEVGDVVEAGQTLFDVRSPLLARDLATESVTAEDLGVAVEDDGTFPVTASVAGTVADVGAPVGDFAAAGTVLASIYRAQTLTVTAQFVLAPRDFGRLGAGSTVELTMPDDGSVTGVVTDIDVDTLGGQAMAEITIDSAALRSQTVEGLYKPGTPVRATLELRDDGPLAGLSDLVHDILRRIGL